LEFGGGGMKEVFLKEMFHVKGKTLEGVHLKHIVSTYKNITMYPPKNNK
jgi:hypothetical protein